MTKANICGRSFEELTNEEMMEYEGGTTSFTPVTPATSLPCGIGASISCIGVSIYYTING